MDIHLPSILGMDSWNFGDWGKFMHTWKKEKEVRALGLASRGMHSRRLGLAWRRQSRSRLRSRGGTVPVERG